MLQYPFIKDSALKACSFIQNTLQQRYFLENNAKLLRTAFYRTSPVAASKNSNKRESWYEMS